MAVAKAVKAARRGKIKAEMDLRGLETAHIDPGYKGGTSRFKYAEDLSRARSDRRTYEGKSSTFNQNTAGADRAGKAARGMKSSATGDAFEYNENAGTLRNFLGAMGSNLTASKEAGGFGGWGGAGKQFAKHAARGAVAGSAIGGTTEWAQGGSFWAGAKEGAFNGAVGWGAYRMAGHAVGATSRNPFAKANADGSGGGLLTAAGNMYGGVSKQVRSIMLAKKNEAVASGNNGLNKGK